MKRKNIKKYRIRGWRLKTIVHSTYNTINRFSSEDFKKYESFRMGLLSKFKLKRATLDFTKFLTNIIDEFRNEVEKTERGIFEEFYTVNGIDNESIKKWFEVFGSHFEAEHEENLVENFSTGLRLFFFNSFFFEFGKEAFDDYKESVDKFSDVLTKYLRKDKTDFITKVMSSIPESVNDTKKEVNPNVTIDFEGMPKDLIN